MVGQGHISWSTFTQVCDGQFAPNFFFFRIFFFSVEFSSVIGRTHVSHWKQNNLLSGFEKRGARLYYRLYQRWFLSGMESRFLEPSILNGSKFCVELKKNASMRFGLRCRRSLQLVRDLSLRPCEEQMHSEMDGMLGLDTFLSKNPGKYAEGWSLSIGTASST